MCGEAPLREHSTIVRESSEGVLMGWALCTGALKKDGVTVTVS